MYGKKGLFHFCTGVDSPVSPGQQMLAPAEVSATFYEFVQLTCYLPTHILNPEFNMEMICCWDHRVVLFLLKHCLTWQRFLSLQTSRWVGPVCLCLPIDYVLLSIVGKLISLPISISFSKRVISASVGFWLLPCLHSSLCCEGTAVRSGDRQQPRVPLLFLSLLLFPSSLLQIISR